MAGLMFACLDAVDGAGLDAITLRMLELVRDSAQKISHQLAAIRVMINVEKHNFQRLKRGKVQAVATGERSAGSLPTVAQELLAFLHTLVARKDAESPLVLRASNLAIAIHKLADDEQEWLCKQTRSDQSTPAQAETMVGRKQTRAEAQSPKPSQRRASVVEPVPSAISRDPSHAPLTFDSLSLHGFLHDIFAHEANSLDRDTGPPDDIATSFSQRAEST